MSERDPQTTTGGLKSTMDRLSPEGWEIQIGGPRIFIVTTPEPLDPLAVEKIEGHFWSDTKIRYYVSATTKPKRQDACQSTIFDGG